jgi:hypothetical protein
MAVILALAAWLRLGNLDQESLFVDEYMHVHAASEILASGAPLLPDGRSYRRALPYTYLVAGSFRLFGISERSARLPSAIAGTLLVLAAFGVGWRWFGAPAGVLAAALVATAPPVVSTARLCRMYSVFELLYLAALFAYERGWEPHRKRPRGRLAWQLAAPLLLFASYRMHLLTASFAAATAVYWPVMLAWTRERVYAAYLLLGAGAAAVALTAGVVDVDHLLDAIEVPDWQQLRESQADFYTSTWAVVYPWLWWVAPPAAVYACWRYGRTGFLLACHFAVPMALCSLVFGRKELRYVSFLFPPLALLLAPVFVALAAALRDCWRREAPQWRSRPLWVRLLLPSLLLQAVALAAIAGAWPPLRASFYLRQRSFLPDWRGAYASVAAAARPGDALLAAVPLSAEYYLPRLGVRLVRSGSAAGGEASGLWLEAEPATWRFSLPELQRLIARHPRGWLVVEPAWFQADSLTAPEVRREIRERMQPVAVDLDPPVLVFHWNSRSSRRHDRTTPRHSEQADARNPTRPRPRARPRSAVARAMRDPSTSAPSLSTSTKFFAPRDDSPS